MWSIQKNLLVEVLLMSGRLAVEMFAIIFQYFFPILLEIQ